MSRNLVLRDRQRERRVNLRLLRKMAGILLAEFAPEGFDLGIYLVNVPEITHLNETYLRHSGSTDVISFDYSTQTRAVGRRVAQSPALLHGEIFVCVEEAVRQSKKFRTSWQSEVARYVVHGVLHLLGYDDSRATDRRRMKREENRLLARLSAQFDLSKLALSPRKPAPKLSV